MKRRALPALISAALLTGLIAGCTTSGDGNKAPSAGGSTPNPDEGSLTQ